MRATKETPLAEIRAAKGMTQKDLADASGVGESTIQLWEANGTMAASVRKLAMVADVLGVEVSALLCEKGA